jgi:acetyl esterase/lipase
MKPLEFVAATAVKASLRLSFKLPSRLPLPLTVLRAAMEQGAGLFKPRPEAIVRRTRLGGVDGEHIACGAPARVMLHFHGGAFFAGSTNTHRAMASEFAARAGVAVYVLNYRLAPENPYPAALDDGLSAYQALLAQGYHADDIILGGDSGGCAHALALTLALRDRGEPLPAGLVMISPYLDMTLSRPSVARNWLRDPMVTAIALRRGADGYCGGIPAHDPRVSPLFADLRGLPPILVQVGSEEILLDDARDFAAMAQAVGVDVDCQVFAGMWHNFQMFNSLIPTADRALNDIADFMLHALALRAGLESAA